MKPPALRTEGIGKHERYGALMEVVRRRYTCRAFAPYEVPREHYELILEAAPPRAIPALALHYRDRSGKALCHRADHQADLSRMWSVITGFLSLTEHPPATINVQHVERGTTHRATLTIRKLPDWAPGGPRHQHVALASAGGPDALAGPGCYFYSAVAWFIPRVA